MLIPIILIFLTISFSILLDKMLLGNFIKIKKDYEHIESNYKRLFQENTKIIQRNNSLRSLSEEIIALYEITKQICKSLDEDKVFDLFKNELTKYIKIEDCKFLRKNTDLSAYTNYTIMPLEIDKTPAAYLAVSGIAESQRAKFNILAQQFVLGIKRAILYRQVQELAITDTLTGVLSRRHWMERFGQEIERSRKFKYSFSFLMLDIDYFKTFNDRYGHLVGDAVLREVSKRIKENIRQIDLVGRYGGEEFSVILIETDKNQARFAAERIRKAIEEKEIRVYDEDLKITISIGISVFPEHADTKEALIEKADEALYRAKQAGRNRVCISGMRL